MKRILLQILLISIAQNKGANCTANTVAGDVEFPADANESDNSFLFGNIDDSNSSPAPQLVDDRVSIKLRIDAASAPCKNSSVNFCDSNVNQLYPARYIKELLERTPSRAALTPIHLSSSSQTVSADDSACASVRSIKYLKVARNTRHVWNFIINVGEFRQPIVIEECVARTVCPIQNFLRVGFTSICSQETRTIPLLSLDGSGIIREYDYRFPSHCRCKVQRRRPKKNNRRFNLNL